MDRDNYDRLAAFSTALPLEGPATAPCAAPIADEELQPSGEQHAPVVHEGDDEAITGAGGAYM
jgi:hypothetical protein